jgi:hypothetical protein
MKTSSIKPLYSTWSNMIQRCCNPKHPKYPRYGGRGITVCTEWKDSYDQFTMDVGNKPEPTYTLDRIDGSLGYSKENCRWASKKTQSINRDYVKNARGYYKSGKTYQALIRINDKKVTKRFKTELEAKEWYENNKPIHSC